MKLVGMLDSPYVRRVAILLQVLGLRFEHQSLSVFRGFDEFRRINPVVKALQGRAARRPHLSGRLTRAGRRPIRPPRRSPQG